MEFVVCGRGFKTTPHQQALGLQEEKSLEHPSRIKRKGIGKSVRGHRTQDLNPASNTLAKRSLPQFSRCGWIGRQSLYRFQSLGGDPTLGSVMLQGLSASAACKPLKQFRPMP